MYIIHIKQGLSPECYLTQDIVLHKLITHWTVTDHDTFINFWIHSRTIDRNGEFFFKIIKEILYPVSMKIYFANIFHGSYLNVVSSYLSESYYQWVLFSDKSRVVKSSVSCKWYCVFCGIPVCTLFFRMSFIVEKHSRFLRFTRWFKAFDTVDHEILIKWKIGQQFKLNKFLFVGKEAALFWE